MADTCSRSSVITLDSYEDPNWGCVTGIMPIRDLDIGHLASELGLWSVSSRCWRACICYSLITGSDPLGTIGTKRTELHRTKGLWSFFPHFLLTIWILNVFTDNPPPPNFSGSQNSLFSRHLLKDWILQCALPMSWCPTFLWSPSLFKRLHLYTQQFWALKVPGVCFVWLLSGNGGL